MRTKFDNQDAGITRRDPVSKLLLRPQPASRVVLHVGCGASTSTLLNREFPKPAWREIRLDIDPNVSPDIVASITDMHRVETGAVDAVFSSHNVEHLFAHEVALAFKEFARVLTPDGYAVIGVPDLQRVAQLIANDNLLDPAYESPAGPITPIDMVYGHHGYLARGHVFMAHKTGFTARSLGHTLVDSGFPRAEITRRDFDLWAVAYKALLPNQ